MISTWNGARGFQRIHQTQKARTVRELRAADPVIHVHVLVYDGATPANCVRSRVFDLARHGLGVVRDPVLLGALPAIDCREKGRRFCGHVAALLHDFHSNVNSH
jgi:hypothetical protein